MLFENKTVFVTGANGFVGSFLVERLLKEGASVKCLVRKTSNLRWLKNLNVTYIYGDVSDIDSFKGALSGINYVFHVAALKHSIHKKDYLKVNCEGTQNLLNIVIKESPKLEKFVFLSSMSVMGYSTKEKTLSESDRCNPLTYYGESKKLAEEACLKASIKIPVTILRPPAVYGPRDEDIFAMFKAVKMGIRPVFGLEKTFISMVYVDDLVEAMVLAAVSRKATNNIYIIAEDRYYSWKEIQDEVAKTLKAKALTVKIPKSILFTAAFLSEIASKVLKKNLLLTRHKVKEMTGHWVCDITKAKTDLRFVPHFSMALGIEKTGKWYKENKWL